MKFNNFNYLLFLIVLVIAGWLEEVQSQATTCFLTSEQCPNQNVSFYFYTRKTQYYPTKLNMFNQKSVLQTKFIPNRPLIILIHGYTGHRDFSPNTEIRPAYFQKGEFNIISLDYHPLAPSPCYLTAVRNIRVVGNCTAQLIDLLVENSIFTFDDIHVIGHSLGGQTAGIIATYLKSGKMKRITGLDPAKPLFITAENKNKIDASDAEFVQIIHTDVFERGILSSAGHADFYVNGGFEQPGCRNQIEESPGSCNHGRAPIFYAESISTKIGFWGYRCGHWYLYVLGMCRSDRSDSMAIMGAYTPNTTRGQYFLRTNAASPYARGKDSSNNKSDQNSDYINYIEDTK